MAYKKREYAPGELSRLMKDAWFFAKSSEASSDRALEIIKGLPGRLTVGIRDFIHRRQHGQKNFTFEESKKLLELGKNLAYSGEYKSAGKIARQLRLSNRWKTGLILGKIIKDAKKKSKVFPGAGLFDELDDL